MRLPFFIILLAGILVSPVMAVTSVERVTYISTATGTSQNLWYFAMLASAVLWIVSIRFLVSSLNESDQASKSEALYSIVTGAVSLIPSSFVALSSNAIVTETSAGIVGSGVTEIYSISSYPTIGLLFIFATAAMLVYTIALAAIYIYAIQTSKNAQENKIIPTMITLFFVLTSVIGVIVVSAGNTGAPVDSYGNTTSGSINQTQGTITNTSATVQTGSNGLILFMVIAGFLTILATLIYYVRKKPKGFAG